MMPLDGRTIVTNGIAKSPVRLSILIPCLHDNPCRLIEILAEQARRCSEGIEIIVIDDGSNDQALTDAIDKAIMALPIPGTFIRLERNGGRAAARNILAQFAAGDQLLFIDADTLPDNPNFLQTYIEHPAVARSAMVIGGFSILQSPEDPQYRLHRHMSSSLDCLSVEARNQQPWKYAFGSNILVRRDVMMEHPFDARYTGWGWEDQEWAIRIAHKWHVEHIDNSVSHLGLDDVQTLLRKYASSGENFRFMVIDHPDEVKQYPAYRASRLLRFIPVRGALRAFAARIARAEWMPLDTRTFAMRAFRALHY